MSKNALGRVSGGKRYGSLAPLTSFYDLPEHFQEQVKEFVTQFGVTDLNVFGSYKRGEQTEESDLDLSTFGHFEKRFTYRDLDIFPSSGGVRIMKNNKFI